MEFLPLDADMVIVIDTLLQTLGPGPNDFECPICQEPIGQESDTVEHAHCHHRFDYECLRNWIESSWKPTCPLCRVRLERPEDTQFLSRGSEEEELEDEPGDEEVAEPMGDTLDLPGLQYEEIWEMEPEERAAYILEFRRAAPDVTEWHVVSCERQILHHLTRVFPREDPVGLSDDVKQEIRLSLDILHSEGPSDAIDTILSATLVRQRHIYRFNSEETQHLWSATRVFGVSHWFKVLFRSRLRCIVFWLPMHEPIRPLRNEDQLLHELQPQTYQRLVERGLSSDLVQVPLKTGSIVKHLGWLDREFQREAQESLRRLIRIAQETKATHWALIAVPWIAARPAVYALPWPRTGLEAGHTTLTFPGWGARSPDIHARQGWTGQLARSCLDSFLENRKIALDRFLEAERHKDQEARHKEAALTLTRLSTNHGEEDSGARAGRRSAP